MTLDAGLAQLVEQLICNQQVVGSTPIASSNHSISITVSINNDIKPRRGARVAKGGGL